MSNRRALCFTEFVAIFPTSPAMPARSLAERAIELLGLDSADELSPPARIPRRKSSSKGRRRELALAQVSSGLGANFRKPFLAAHPLISGKFPGNFLSLHLPRLKKSGIECVILAKSSLFTLSRAQSRYGSGLTSSWGAQGAIFSMILRFFALDIANFRSGRGISRF